MTFLQAFADDSASERGDQRLFIAGYMNRADKWALFSDAWDEQLRDAPSIEYLKMAEANNLRGQFQDWSEEVRDEKLRGLARVIRHFQPLSFEVSVPRDEYSNLIKPVSPRGFANPHFMCVFGVISILTRFAAGNGATMPIKFIFDEQDGVSADVHVFFDHMLARLPSEAKALINSAPAFEDDKLVLPLQAADMLAWHVRREHEVFGRPGTLPMADLLRNEEGHLVSNFDSETLQRWSREFAQVPGVPETQSKSQWRAIRKQYAASQPTLPRATNKGVWDRLSKWVRDT